MRDMVVLSLEEVSGLSDPKHWTDTTPRMACCILKLETIIIACVNCIVCKCHDVDAERVEESPTLIVLHYKREDGDGLAQERKIIRVLRERWNTSQGDFRRPPLIII